MSGCIRYLTILHSPVFLLNSCLDLFSAPVLRRDPLSRSYRVNLPSSLTVNLSSALVSSTRPRVSVSGTGGIQIIASEFSWEYGYHLYPIARGRSVLSGSTGCVDLPALPLSTPFNLLFRQQAGVSLLRRRFALYVGNGILTVEPSAAPFGCALGPDLP